MTYGVLMVKPRTTGVREMRAATAVMNFMVVLVEGARGRGRRGHKREERWSTTPLEALCSL